LTYWRHQCRSRLPQDVDRKDPQAFEAVPEPQVKARSSDVDQPQDTGEAPAALEVEKSRLATRKPRI
jgi:hypothetical protein